MRIELFDELLESVTEAKAIARGKKAPTRAFGTAEVLAGRHPDVAALRKHFGLSQSKFAALLGISVDTLQNWEQKRRRPDGPAKVLLRIAATHPEALLDKATARAS
ncbi:MAG: helix-turn-helix domain-containing protein [Gemmatimonadaceae bacterium]|nr:helix-turn-helix domain-containing protein [Gemmatimonadaceae bacterium]